MSVTTICDDCGGSGVDSGSLHEPEACPVCQGSGRVLPPEEVERIAQVYRKPVARAPLPAGYFEERSWRFGE